MIEELGYVSLFTSCFFPVTSLSCLVCRHWTRSQQGAIFILVYASTYFMCLYWATSIHGA